MKKKLLLFYSAVFLPYLLFSQNVGIGNPTPNTSAQLDITSTNKGLLIPRMPTLESGFLAQEVEQAARSC